MLNILRGGFINEYIQGCKFANNYTLPEDIKALLNMFVCRGYVYC